MRTVERRGNWSIACAAAAIVGVVALPMTAHAGFATQVIGYEQGTGLSASDAAFDDPATTLGEPARMTGLDTNYAATVSVFNPVWRPSQAVSLGVGGSLVVGFDTPVVDDPDHLYGVDLIVFGNAGLLAADYINGITGSPAEFLDAGRGKIEVSADGVNFFEIPGVFADQLFPTQGYLDTGMWDTLPGNAPSDFYKPVNPAYTLADFAARSYGEILSMYDGSGGGLPIDLAWAVDAQGQPAGLTSAHYVRVSHVGTDGDTQIEAFVAVPEPATLALFVVCGLMLARQNPRGKGSIA